MIGFQTHSALLAPAWSKIARTWFHACTYSPARLPFLTGDQGRQSPFISGAQRISTGMPKLRIWLAQRAIKVS